MIISQYYNRHLRIIINRNMTRTHNFFPGGYTEFLLNDLIISIFSQILNFWISQNNSPMLNLWLCSKFKPTWPFLPVYLLPRHTEAVLMNCSSPRLKGCSLCRFIPCGYEMYFWSFMEPFFLQFFGLSHGQNFII